MIKVKIDFSRQLANLIPWYPFIFLTITVILVGFLSSCDRQRMVPVGVSDKLLLNDPPTIRVRIFSRSISRVSVGSSGAYSLIVDGREKYRQPRQEANKTFVITRSRGLWHLGGDSFSGAVILLKPIKLNPTAKLGYVTLKKPGIATVNQYRGRFKLISQGSDSFLLINEVDLESYLAGVLPREMYPSWPIDALQAQAVAARTHAWFTAIKSGTRRHYHVNDDTSNQVYGGIAGETVSSNRAVRNTRGVVLAVNKSGNNEMFLVQYSSCCGGTVNGADVIRSNVADIAPLKGGQSCTYCNLPNNKNFRWPTVIISKSQLFQELKRKYSSISALGGISKIKVRSRSNYGRMLWIDLIGPAGKRETIRAEDLRLSVISKYRGLKSMNCTIVDYGDSFGFTDGRGWGHGVGMCQWGANGKARAGCSWKEILNFYYPGATLYKAY